MVLKFETGEQFASGAVRYSVSGTSVSSRLTVEVTVDGRRTEAIVDTGAPFLICSPELAEQLGLDPNGRSDRKPGDLDPRGLDKRRNPSPEPYDTRIRRKQPFARGYGVCARPVEQLRGEAPSLPRLYGMP